jgi:oligoribonuclease NrnB/cAMP/cGMP phosphodiesterase (DHH superfamily)
VYQTEPPDVTGKDVIMVDFSYKRPVILKMAKQAKSILIIDHHKTAEAELVDLPENVEVFFGQDHSGAMLAWLYFYTDYEPPEVLKHIEDRDLWKFDLDGTREIQAALFSYPYDLEVWGHFLWADPVYDLLHQGKSILRAHNKNVDELIKNNSTRMKIAGYDVPVLNAPIFFTSDAGHIMARGEPFAACWFQVPDGVVFSLRSTEDGLDVSEIAKQYGGGGHKHAAGFKIPFEKFSFDGV